jgi:hypothetical protein
MEKRHFYLLPSLPRDTVPRTQDIDSNPASNGKPNRRSLKHDARKTHHHGGPNLPYAHYYTIDWHCSLDDAKTWHRLTDLNTGDSGLRTAFDKLHARAPSLVQIRAPIADVVAFLEQELEELVPPLKAIMGACNPPLSIEEAWELAMKGSTPAQRSVGVPKYIGGVKMDGSTYPVEIL